MRKLQFRERNQTISERDLAQLEKKLGASLPSDYRTLLLETNGGFVSRLNEYFPLRYQNAQSVFGGGFLVENIFPVKDNDYPEGELWSNAECFLGRIPKHTIPIARNAFGDLILLGVHEPAVDVVYAWDHEHEGFVKWKKEFRNVYKLSKSFADFVDNLTVHPKRI